MTSEGRQHNVEAPDEAAPGAAGSAPDGSHRDDPDERPDRRPEPGGWAPTTTGPPAPAWGSPGPTPPSAAPAWGTPDPAGASATPEAPTHWAPSTAGQSSAPMSWAPADNGPSSGPPQSSGMPDDQRAADPADAWAPRGAPPVTPGWNPDNAWTQQPAAPAEQPSSGAPWSPQTAPPASRPAADAPWQSTAAPAWPSGSPSEPGAAGQQPDEARGWPGGNAFAPPSADPVAAGRAAAAAAAAAEPWSPEDAWGAARTDDPAGQPNDPSDPVGPGSDSLSQRQRGRLSDEHQPSDGAESTAFPQRSHDSGGFPTAGPDRDLSEPGPAYQPAPAPGIVPAPAAVPLPPQQTRVPGASLATAPPPDFDHLPAADHVPGDAPDRREPTGGGEASRGWDRESFQPTGYEAAPPTGSPMVPRQRTGGFDPAAQDPAAGSDPAGAATAAVSASASVPLSSRVMPPTDQGLRPGSAPPQSRVYGRPAAERSEENVGGPEPDDASGSGSGPVDHDQPAQYGGYGQDGPAPAGTYGAPPRAGAPAAGTYGTPSTPDGPPPGVYGQPPSQDGPPPGVHGQPATGPDVPRAGGTYGQPAGPESRPAGVYGQPPNQDAPPPGPYGRPGVTRTVRPVTAVRRRSRTSPGVPSPAVPRPARLSRAPRRRTRHRMPSRAPVAGRSATRVSSSATGRAGSRSVPAPPDRPDSARRTDPRIRPAQRTPGVRPAQRTPGFGPPNGPPGFGPPDGPPGFGPSDRPSSGPPMDRTALAPAVPASGPPGAWTPPSDAAQNRFDSFSPQAEPAPAEESGEQPVPQVRNVRVLITVLTAAVLLLVVAFGLVWLFSGSDDKAAFNPDVGSCVKQSGEQPAPANCGDAGAFKVLSKVPTKDKCPDQAQPHIVLKATDKQPEQVLCLQPATAG
ncbi:LppU/SCO3897 family protein [Micromonospora zhanjiangensis]